MKSNKLISLLTWLPCVLVLLVFVINDLLYEWITLEAQPNLYDALDITRIVAVPLAILGVIVGWPLVHYLRKKQAVLMPGQTTKLSRAAIILNILAALLVVGYYLVALLRFMAWS